MDLKNLLPIVTFIITICYTNAQVGRVAHPDKKKFSGTQVSDSIESSGFYAGGLFDYDKDGIADKREIEGISQFEFISGNFTWRQAYNDAKIKGGMLATVSSKSENDHLLIISNKKRGWIGGLDADLEGDWNWVDGAPFKYQNWKDKQPDNAGGKEHFLEIQSDGKWNDLPQDHKLGYYLEKKIRTNPNLADSDGDGYTDLVEIKAKSDPNNRLSVPYKDIK